MCLIKKEKQLEYKVILLKSSSQPLFLSGRKNKKHKKRNIWWKKRKRKSRKKRKRRKVLRKRFVHATPLNDVFTCTCNVQILILQPSVKYSDTSERSWRLWVGPQSENLCKSSCDSSLALPKLLTVPWC